MTNIIKSAALVALMGSTAAPVFAAAHADPATLTCGEYLEMGMEDQKTTYAALAVAADEAVTTDPLTDGEAKAVEPTGDETTAAEADTSTGEPVTDGEAKAVEPTGGNAASSMDETDADMEQEMLAMTNACEADPSKLALDAVGEARPALEK